jgi:hypothetical protein
MVMPCRRFSGNQKERGASALLIVLLIGGIILEIAVVFLFINFYLGESGFGAELSLRALGAARSGLDDALLRVIRDINLANQEYTLNSNNVSSLIVICNGSKTINSNCDTSNIGKIEITSLGQAGTRQRKLRAFLNVNSRNGEINIESIKEISL